MDVSVIILNYNTFEVTCNCIRSIYRFTSGIEVEIILVDNGSVECDAELFKKEFADIILLKSQENLGFAKGNNLGIKQARGKYLLLLNSDILLTENSILKCADKLAALPEDTTVITCKLIYPDGKVQYQCNRFPSISKKFMEFSRLHKLFSVQKRGEYFLSSYFNYDTDIYPDWIWGAFFMFKKEFLSLLPGHKLNEDYFMYSEDMKWCYDFKKAGGRVYYYAGTRVIHFHGQSVAGKANIGADNIRNDLDFVLKTKGRLYLMAYKTIGFFNEVSSN